MAVAELIWGLYAKTHRYFKNPPSRPDRMSRKAVGALQVMGSTIMVLNYFWFSKMLRGAMKVFAPKRKPQQLQDSGKDSGAEASSSTAADAAPLEPAPGEVAPDPHAPPPDNAFANSSEVPARQEEAPGQDDIEVIDVADGDI